MFKDANKNKNAIDMQRLDISVIQLGDQGVNNKRRQQIMEGYL